MINTDNLIFKGLMNEDRQPFYEYLVKVKECIDEALGNSYEVKSSPLSDNTIGAKTEQPKATSKQSPSVIEVLEKTSNTIANPVRRPGKGNNLYKWAGFKEESYGILSSYNDKLHHFPFLKGIEQFIEYLPEKEKTIIHHCMNFYTGEDFQDMLVMAEKLGLTRERIRQLQSKIFYDLDKKMHELIQKDMLNGYKYDISSETNIRHIATLEDVPFNDNFIVWVAACANKNYWILGKIKDVFLKYPATGLKINAVDKEIAQYFDFENFFKIIAKMEAEKRFVDFRDDLEVFIRSICNTQIEDEKFFKVIKECRRLLERNYPDNIINSQLFFPANSRKNIPELIEDILRAKGKPMSSEEISEQLNRTFPDLKRTPKKIGPNAIRNPNIVAVSRTSTYALKEWDSIVNRGGTIRNFAEEYLNSLIEPIAPIPDICDYIARFRANVQEISVKTNLLAESSNKFSLYFKGNVQYIGYSNYDFDSSYETKEKRKERRSFEDSINRLEHFIVLNEHFPYITGETEEERRLNRFFGICTLRYQLRQLSPKESQSYEHIVTTYSEFKESKERFSWEKRLENFVSYVTNNNSLPSHNSFDYIWYQVYRQKYENGELDSSKQIAFKTLLRFVDSLQN